MNLYVSRTKPYAHQADILERTAELRSYALFWEMGVAKSKPIIDTIGARFVAGDVNGALIVAPKAVAPNWVNDELPAHLGLPYRVFLWDTSKAGGKKYQADLAAFLKTPDDQLAVLVMSYPAIMTERRPGAKPMRGKEAAKKFLTGRRVLMCLDESARVKNPDAKTTKRVIAAGRHAEYRRILTGTPVPNGPFDVYSQLRFLDPDIWKRVGCGTFAAFKTMYGVWVEHQRADNGQKFKTLVDYQNLAHLNEVIDSVGDRLLLDDVLDLPAKSYKRLEFDMAPRQRELYRELRDTFMVELESGDMITAPLAIQRVLRLQQVTSGYCPTDDGDTVVIEPNPRLDLLSDFVDDIPHQALIWFKFHHDGDLIMDMLARRKKTAVLYDGRVGQTDREARRESFKAGDVQFFVANPAAAGEGLTLHMGKTAVFYNTTYKLGDRLQAEARNRRAGMDDRPVTYVDLVARGTIDAPIIRALRQKNDLAAQVMGDRLRAWI